MPKTIEELEARVKELSQVESPTQEQVDELNGAVEAFESAVSEQEEELARSESQAEALRRFDEATAKADDLVKNRERRVEEIAVASVPNHRVDEHTQAGLHTKAELDAWAAAIMAGEPHAWGRKLEFGKIGELEATLTTGTGAAPYGGRLLSRVVLDDFWNQVGDYSHFMSRVRMLDVPQVAEYAHPGGDVSGETITWGETAAVTPDDTDVQEDKDTPRRYAYAKSISSLAAAIPDSGSLGHSDGSDPRGRRDQHGEGVSLRYRRRRQSSAGPAEQDRRGRFDFRRQQQADLGRSGQFARGTFEGGMESNFSIFMNRSRMIEAKNAVVSGTDSRPATGWTYADEGGSIRCVSSAGIPVYPSAAMTATKANKNVVMGDFSQFAVLNVTNAFAIEDVTGEASRLSGKRTMMAEGFSTGLIGE